MSARIDGGQAFPWTERDGPVAVTRGGMSLRDYLVAQALPVCLQLATDDNTELGGQSRSRWEWAAIYAYSAADAVLARREV